MMLFSRRRLLAAASPGEGHLHAQPLHGGAVVGEYLPILQGLLHRRPDQVGLEHLGGLDGKQGGAVHRLHRQAVLRALHRVGDGHRRRLRTPGTVQKDLAP